MLLLPILIALVPAPGGRGADDAGLRALLNRTDAPARVKDLGSGWLSLTVVRWSKPAGSAGILGAVQTMLGDNDQRLRGVSRGETIAEGGHRYMVVYRINAPPLDLMRLMKMTESGA